MKIRSLLLALTILGGVLLVDDTTSAQSWVATSAPVTNWTVVACSADGIKLVAVVSDNSGNDDPHGRIYTSADSGVTWTATSAPLDSWTSVASSADGTRLIAGSYGKPIYTSVDSGATWIESDSPGAFRSVACSSDGTKLFGANFGPFSYIYSLTPTDGWLAALPALSITLSTDTALISRPASAIQDPSCAVIVPLEISLACGIEGSHGKIELYRIFGCSAQPLVYLSMAISKGESTCSIMVGRGKITPSARGTAYDEKGVIDRIGVFVNRQPRLGWTRNLRRFQILSVSWISPRLT